MSVVARTTKGSRRPSWRGVGCLTLVLLVALLPLPTRPPAFAQDQTQAANSAFTLAWSSSETYPTTSTAWGDYDGDGDLDLAVGNYERPNQVYRNDDGTLTPAWEAALEEGATTPDRTFSVAWGDYDRDGDLDLVVGNGCSIYNRSSTPEGQPNRLYRNENGVLSSRAFWSSAETDCTFSVAWGDYDNDGYPDLAVGNGAIQRQNLFGNEVVAPLPLNNRIYHNTFAGSPATPFAGAWNAPTADPTTSVAWGDYDGDGDLDLAVGNIGLTATLDNLGSLNLGSFDRLYNNRGPAADGTPRFEQVWESNQLDPTFSVAWADVNGDGRLDLALGNINISVPDIQIPRYRNRLYLGQSNTLTPAAWNPPDDTTLSVAWGDYDGDGDPDLAVGNAGAAGSSSVGQRNKLYRNDNGTLTNTAVWESQETDDTISVAWGDYDGDGALDLIAGNAGVLFANSLPGQPNRLYRNTRAGLETRASWSSPDVGAVYGVAWGDVDGDGDLDLAAAVPGAANQLYLNTQGQLTRFAAWQPAATNTTSIAWGDVDGDGDLDLVAGNFQTPTTLYRNCSTRQSGDGCAPGDTFLSAAPVWSAPEISRTWSLAWGDVDSDGDLDLAVGNIEQPSQLYRNAGGQLTLDPAWTPAAAPTTSLAWGDVDNDGDLDLLLGNECTQAIADCRAARIYLNQRGTLSATPAWQSSEADQTQSVAWGDVDGDGDLDLATGNLGQPNRLYRNCGIRQAGDGCADGEALMTANAVWASVEADVSVSVAWGDADGDGDLDLAVGNAGFFAGNTTGQQNRLYRNDNGTLSAYADWSSDEADLTRSVAWGDVDGDGALDLIAGNDQAQGRASISLRLYRNLRPALRGAEALPSLRLAPPVATPPLRSANFYATTQILPGPTIVFTYTLTHPRSLPVRQIIGEFSLDGGDNWQTAVPSDTVTTNLATAPGGVTHSYAWDVFGSDIMGQSDSVVFRLRALPDVRPQPPYTNRTAEHYLYGTATAATFPFRVRGTQVRVLQQNDVPAQNALVYRLPQGQTRGARPLADSLGVPFRTDTLGYLQGRQLLRPGDRLVALLPISATTTYSLYLTSARPTPSGLDSAIVTTGGVQTLTVAPSNPLALFNLDVALEWDARADPRFLAQLEADLKRSSELLFTWSNGQAALGQITVYQDKARWNDAHIRIYTTNRLRPNANQGGIVTDVITDPVSLRATNPVTPALIYEPGQLRMGATWNRFGEPDGNLGEDWPRTLAHELGHFALFLDDNYIGLDETGVLVPVESCPSAMSDPYRDDYGAFHPDAGWLPACANTLSNRATGRSDWATIKTFLDWSGLNFVLNMPATFNTPPGPGTLPLEITQIRVRNPTTPVGTLPAPFFSLRQAETQTRYLVGGSARAFLFNADETRLLDLGSPTRDQLLARGARAGDRLCVYDLPQQRLGCETLAPGDDQIDLLARSDWQPEVQLTPVTSRTLALQVSNLSSNLTLKARLFPGYSAPGEPSFYDLTLAPATQGYSGTFVLASVDPAFEGYVHVWVDEATPRREVVTDYALGGNPGNKKSRNAPRASPGNKKSRNAPILSADGQVILYGEQLDFAVGSFYTLQAATLLPDPPLWATVVGQAYRLSASANAPDLRDTSISIGYLGRDVPAGEESGIAIYYWDESLAAPRWERLPTHLDTYQNLASVATRGAGLYALMTSVAVPIRQAGWNLVAYPVRATRPVTAALASIEGAYTTVYGYDGRDARAPWHVYDVAAPFWVNDLTELTYGQGYWINATEAITLYLKGDGGAAPQTAQASSVGLPTPPATYYGRVEAGSDFTPSAGQTVTASINGVRCGAGETLLVNGQVVYSVSVLADDGGLSAGCGVPGREVTFEVGSQVMATRVVWDNSRVREVHLSPPPAAAASSEGYIPIVQGWTIDGGR